MAFTAAQLLAFQAEAEARRAEADALAATAFAAYTAGYHSLCAEVGDEIVNIPVSPYSAALLFEQDLAAWRTALGIETSLDTPTDPADIAAWKLALSVPDGSVVLGDALTALDALTPAANSIPYFTGIDSAGLLSLSADVLDILSATNDADILSKLGITTGAGDVVGPVGAVTDSALVLFDGIDGKTLKAGIVPSANVWTLLGKASLAEMKTYLEIGGSGSGDVVGPAGATSGNLVTFGSASGLLIADSTIAAGLIPQKASTAALTGDKALITDANGKVAASVVTKDQLAYVANIPANTNTSLAGKLGTSDTAYSAYRIKDGSSADHHKVFVSPSTSTPSASAAGDIWFVT